MPPHPSLSISMTAATAALDCSREHQQPPDSAPQDSLRPSPKACISHHRRTLPTRPLFKGPQDLALKEGKCRI
ncbi:hypothetical protein EPR50_G00225060 [Perca flavescens]|uniref:Uncharacterized protein n=1 Tax=Perca flavescens TaxID=8167 RepID=A0A484C6J6_PERFV|nr:hypothetical protein EPR50_G00225060 [Perca flavescens]